MYAEKVAIGAALFTTTEVHMDPTIARFKLFIAGIQRQLTSYLELHPHANFEEASNTWRTLIDTCHQLIDRREAYIRTRRRGTVRPSWCCDRSLDKLYSRLTALSQASSWAKSQVEVLVDEMIICFEQAIEYFIRGAELWRETAA
jgi:hypothetical protein